jgi:hypothetical protein
MDFEKAIPIMDNNANANHLRFAIEVVKYVSKCYQRYDGGNINHELEIYGMEQYVDLVQLTPNVVSALEQLTSIVEKHDIRILSGIACQQLPGAETDEDIIARTFPLV